MCVRGGRDCQRCCVLGAGTALILWPPKNNEPFHRRSPFIVRREVVFVLFIFMMAWLGYFGRSETYLAAHMRKKAIYVARRVWSGVSIVLPVVFRFYARNEVSWNNNSLITWLYTRRAIRTFVQVNGVREEGLFC